MIYKNLGSSNIRVSTLGLGTNGIGNFQNNNPDKTHNLQKIYQFALERGINLFDTAELYGEGYAEFILGETFKKKREQIVISSKVNPDNCTHFGLKRSIKESIKRLGTDYIDLYQIHWINPFVELEETFTILEELVLAGYIRAIGVCNFSISMVAQTSKYLKKIKISSNHIEINLFNQYEALKNLHYYQENKISIIGYGVLNHLNLNFTKKQQAFLDDLQKEYNKTLSQILIRYFTSLESIILLSRTDNIEHLKTNVGSFDFNLTAKQRQQFYKLFQYKFQTIPMEKIKIPQQFKKFNNFEIFKNQNNLIPSPLTIAQTFVKYNYFKPLKLLEKNDYYYLDSYDFYGELKKYLAWRILYDFSKPIPSIVF